MAFRVCRDGALRPRLLPYLSILTLKAFPRIGANGTRQSGEPDYCPNR